MNRRNRMQALLLKPLLLPALLLVLALLGAAGATYNGASQESKEGVAAEQSEPTAERIEPTRDGREKARVINELLEEYHYGQRHEDSALLDYAVDAYLKRLDPGRFYLIAEDVDPFRNRFVKAGHDGTTARIKAAFALHAIYRQRVDQRIEYALGLLEAPFDFERKGHRYEQDRRGVEWAKNDEQLEAVWRKRVAHDVLTLELAGRDEEEIRDNLQRRYRNILEQQTQEVGSEKVMELYLDAWASAFDPHSAYFSPRRSEEFDMQMSLQLEGIGAQLTMEQDTTEIVELIPGGPAERSGKLKAGERIIGVADGDDGEMKDVVGWQLYDIVQLIRGPKESVVRLKVLPPSSSGESTPREVRLVRNQVDLEDQAAHKSIIETSNEGTTQRVGVIEIPRFYRDFDGARAGRGDYRSTTRDVQRLLGELVEEGIDGLLIDLRGNSGGAMNEALELTALFTGGGPVVQVRRHEGSVEQLGSSTRLPAYSGPLGVVVDRRSASASEIFAAAIQDYGRGVVLGDQTYGKGTVQHMIDLDAHGISGKNGAGRLKLTVAQFYRVNGQGTQLVGVTPDLALPSVLDHDEYGERAADNPLPAREIDPIAINNRPQLDPIIEELKRRHAERLQQDEAFRAFKNELAYQRQLREESSIALNREQRQLEQDEREEQLLTLHNQRRQAHDLDPVASFDQIDKDALPDPFLRVSADVIVDLASLLEAPHKVGAAEHEGVY